jgi:hypothetical protein
MRALILTYSHYIRVITNCNEDFNSFVFLVTRIFSVISIWVRESEKNEHVPPTVTETNPKPLSSVAYIVSL